MSNDEQKVYDAAKHYVQFCTPVNFAKLITAVMDLPMRSWPAEACTPKPKVERTVKSNLAALAVGGVLTQPKPEPGDAAYPDRIIDLETGKPTEKK